MEAIQRAIAAASRASATSMSADQMTALRGVEGGGGGSGPASSASLSPAHMGDDDEGAAETWAGPRTKAEKARAKEEKKKAKDAKAKADLAKSRAKKANLKAEKASEATAEAKAEVAADESEDAPRHTFRSLEEACRLRYIQLFFESSPGSLAELAGLPNAPKGKGYDLSAAVAPKAAKLWDEYQATMTNHLRAENNLVNLKNTTRRLDSIEAKVVAWRKLCNDVDPEKYVTTG